jgi:nicotinamide mononucleotide transporter
MQSPLFVALGTPVSWAEILGDVTGGLCVWLVARGSIWNWPLGLANNAFWAVAFYTARLYADATLQLVFFLLGVWGWWLWARTGPRAGAGPRRTRRAEWVGLTVGTMVATAGVAFWLARSTDSPVPIADASVLTLSLAATYGQGRKLIESWWIWIAVDVISVPLYVARGLYPTAILYTVFGALCVAGLRRWTRELRAQEAAA